MTFGSATESNPEDKVNNSPDFLRVNQAGAGEGGADSEAWNRVYMITPVKKFGRVRLSSISFKTNMVEKADMEGRWVFAQFLVFLHPNIKKRFSRTFLMEFLDIRRRDVWTVHGWLHLAWFGISASSVIYKLREFSSNQPSLHLLYFSTYSGIENSLPYPKHMLRAHYKLLVWVLQQSYGNVH